MKSLICLATLLPSLGVLAPSVFAASPPSNSAAAKPNVLFIAIDDLRDWTGYLGHNPQVKTPNLDRLAAMGMAFNRAYPPAPVCNPSRAALMSGRYPWQSGVYENNNDWRTVIPSSQTLTNAFRQGGYSVRGAGKIYHEAYTRRSEWDEYLPTEGSNPHVPKGKSDGVGGIKFGALDGQDSDLPDWKIADYGIAQLALPHDKPFFLAVGLHKPHMPWNVPQKYFDMFPLSTIELPPYLENDLDDLPPAGVKMAHEQTDHIPMLKSGRWKEAVQAYLATIAYTDMNVGRVLDALEKSAYKDNTIICLWGDHGWHLGEKHHWRKFALWEEATRTPYIWVVPGMTKPGSKTDHPVDLMSIYPTMAALCGLPKPANVEGSDLSPLLKNPNAAWSTPVLTTYRFKNHTVRVDGWRYIRYANGDEELYNEYKDPNEWTNLAMKPEFAAKKTELAKFLPKTDAPDIGGRAEQGAEDFGDAPAKKERGKRAKEP